MVLLSCGTWTLNRSLLSILPRPVLVIQVTFHCFVNGYSEDCSNIYFLFRLIFRILLFMVWDLDILLEFFFFIPRVIDGSFVPKGKKLACYMHFRSFNPRLDSSLLVVCFLVKILFNIGKLLADIVPTESDIVI